MLKKFWHGLWEFVKMLAISLAIIVPIRYFLVQPFYVKGASMEPNFHDHEYLVIDEIGYRFNMPERGEIVVFRYPKNPKEYFIKRLIGLPGETVQIKEGQVWIFNKDNIKGFELSESYLPKDLETYSLDNSLTQLGPDEYYVLGDNRIASRDSRSFGPVNKSYLVGRVWLRGWPFNKAMVFKAPSYNQ